MKRAFGLAALLVAAAVAAAGYHTVISRRPEAVLRQALLQTLQAQSAAFDFQLSQKQPGQPAGVWQLEGGLASQGRFQLSGQYGRSGQSVGIEARSPDGQDAYLKLTRVSNLATLLGPEAAEYGITSQRNPLQALEGVWLTIPAGIKRTVVQGEAADKSAGGSLTDADRRRLAVLYQRHPFLVVDQVLADETVAGTESYHYRLKLDRQRLQAFLTAAQKEVPRLELGRARVQSIMSFASRARPFEAWIGKTDKRFSKLRYADTGTTTTELSLELTDYGRPLSISRPEAARPLFEALSGLRR